MATCPILLSLVSRQLDGFLKITVGKGTWTKPKRQTLRVGVVAAVS